MKYTLGIVLLLLFVLPGRGFSQDATEILRNTLSHLQSGSTYAELNMSIERADWSKQMSFRMWIKGEEKALIQITTPEREKGLVFLKSGEEIWNWQPTIQKAIKLPASMMMQSWMGSDFSNDNLMGISSYMTDFTHEFKGDELVGGASCWKVILKAKDDADIIWGEIRTWINQEKNAQVKTEFYDEDSFLIHTVSVTEFQKNGAHWVPKVMEIIPAESENERTLIEYEKLDLNASIKDSFFTLDNIKVLP